MLTATLVVLGFDAALFFGGILLPGLHVEGQPLADGTRRRYKLSGAVLFAATHVVLLVGTLAFGLSLAPLLDLFWPLLWATNALAITVGVALYVQGTRRGAPRDLGHFLMGPELNPTWLGVDLKMLAYQPSLIGLWCLVLAFAYAQWEGHGTITGRMLLFQAFWWIYLVTHYQREAFMLQTWDVIAEHFGLALAWGDLVLVPFFYCIAGWALVDDLRPLSTANAAALVGFYGFALWLFRGANDQKNRFKADRGARIWGRPAETLEDRLLVSGWWGIGRHLNYTGEILVYLAIAMTTGAQSIVPYLLPFWLTGLLAHRALRDERRCRAKYGALWDAYCARAPFRMLPFLY